MEISWCQPMLMAKKHIRVDSVDHFINSRKILVITMHIEGDNFSSLGLVHKSDTAIVRVYADHSCVQWQCLTIIVISTDGLTITIHCCTGCSYFITLISQSTPFVR